MKALTIRQPWAWALIHGQKRIENRSRPTVYRGLLAIHAGLSRQWLNSEWMIDAHVPPAEQLAFGAVIGIVELVDCVRFDELDACSHDVGDRRYAFGPWCWITARPRSLVEALPWRGRQSFFELPELPELSRLQDSARPQIESRL